MAITTIYLVRHAHADWPGDDDRPLSEAGRKAARVVAQLLSGFPITGIYSSPSRRSIETVTPLVDCVGVRPELVRDLRERALPIVTGGEFHRLVEDTWRSPEKPTDAGESNAMAQARGLAVMRRVVVQHQGHHVVVATHGNLLALILHGLDAAFGYEFWCQLSFPDVYRLEFEGAVLIGVRRIWGQAASSMPLQPPSCAQRATPI